MTHLNALTIDVEDYFQVTAFEKDISRASWPEYPSRVERNTHRLLDIFDAHGVKATFFVLGWTAERYPQLVRDIASEGHEVGSHGFWHRLVYEQDPTEFRADLRQSRDVLEGIAEVPVVAYRAPSFSITEQSLWAIDILAEEGFRIDASIYPTWHDRYGIPDAPLNIHTHRTVHGDVREFPSTVFDGSLIRIPVSGGGYFRLLPYWLTKRLLTRVNDTRPFMFYLHPWEIDPDQPRLVAGGRSSRIRHRVNLQSTELKLNKLLDQFTFGTISQAIAAAPVCELDEVHDNTRSRPEPLGCLETADV